MADNETRNDEQRAEDNQPLAMIPTENSMTSLAAWTDFASKLRENPQWVDIVYEFADLMWWVQTCVHEHPEYFDPTYPFPHVFDDDDAYVAVSLDREYGPQLLLSAVLFLDENRNLVLVFEANDEQEVAMTISDLHNEWDLLEYWVPVYRDPTIEYDDEPE